MNGTPYAGKIDDSGAYVVCCDGAYDWAKGKVRIDENIGDFDSLGYEPYPPPAAIYPAEKDFTDGEIGLRRLINAGCNTIEVYGGTGGRADHFIGNLHLLYYAHAHGITATMISDDSFISMGSGKIGLGAFAGKTVSVLPFGGTLNIISSTGLKYTEPQALSYGECRGVSNVVNSGAASITVAHGSTALIIVNRGEV